MGETSVFRRGPIKEKISMIQQSDSILVYATDWCFDCRRARRFFDKNQISYTWINIDNDREGEQRVLQLNRGMRSVPTIVFQDGSVLVEPSDEQLRRKLIPQNG
jgi:mycoredoxin